MKSGFVPYNEFLFYKTGCINSEMFSLYCHYYFSRLKDLEFTFSICNKLTFEFRLKSISFFDNYYNYTIKMEHSPKNASLKTLLILEE